MTTDPPRCRELVELVTDYLDGALPPVTQAAVARHLRGCPGCVAHVEQIRATARALASGPHPELDPEICAALLAAFRDWTAGHHTDR